MDVFSRLNQLQLLLQICHRLFTRDQIPGLGRSTGEGIDYPHQYSWASLVAQLIICLQCRKPGFDPWVGKIPWTRERLHTPVFWPGEFHELYNHGVTKSQTQLSDFRFQIQSYDKQQTHFKSQKCLKIKYKGGKHFLLVQLHRYLLI